MSLTIPIRYFLAILQGRVKGIDRIAKSMGTKKMKNGSFQSGPEFLRQEASTTRRELVVHPECR